MSLTDRDRKLLMVLAAVVALAGYWFLLLSPQRDAAAEAGAELAEQETRRDEALAQLERLESARSSYAADYAALVRVGKAVPTSVDMSSLMVQLQRAARGTGIEFERIATGEESESTPATTPPPPTGAAPEDPAAPPATGTPPDAASGAPPAEAEAPPTTGDGSLPVGGGAVAPAESGPVGASPLESVPLEFSFQGSFFQLADFFHEIKRFVTVSEDRLRVSGRLLTIDQFTFTSDESFPELQAEVTATVYVMPELESAGAGTTPEAPAGAAPAATASTPTEAATP